MKNSIITHIHAFEMEVCQTQNAKQGEKKLQATVQMSKQKQINENFIK
jgi:hypothetical protein